MRFYIILFNISQNRHVNDCAVTYPSPFNNVRSSAVVKINGSWQRLLVTAFGRLELEWCERKTLLPDWWLEAGAGVV